MKHNLHKIIPSWLIISAAVFISLLFVIAASGFLFSEMYASKIAPGVKVGSMSIGGKTPGQARSILEDTISRFDNGVPVHFEDKTVPIGAQMIGLNPDLDIRLITFDIDETLREAWAVGRSDNWLQSRLQSLQSFVFGHSVQINIETDRDGLTAFLKKQFVSFETPARNASLSFDGKEVSVVPEQSGRQLDYKQAVDDVLSRLHLGSVETVEMKAELSQPEVKSSEVHDLLPQATDFLNFPDSKLVFEKEIWLLNKNLAKEWLGFAKDENGIHLALDSDKIKDFLNKEVAPKVNSEGVEARLSMNNNRVSVWQAGKNGVELNADETARLIADWPNSHPDSISVAVKESQSVIADATAESLGLKEIIGTGTSQFAGSPVNRRHNIKVGADALNGLLIKPGEEFSLLKALGEIDGQHGYLPELVIKGDKTTPEFGGGLCQIGTTMFRATFNSGLPVTDRRNHSYRVVYYEPAGTDATIYDPAPDYRFINDTGHYILIQARLAGNNLAFDFWGTNDGRNIEVSKPVVYNITPPPPLKTVETPDLPEGQKKCTEKAHNGADAYFDYKVTYPNGDIKQKRFSSHYIPWQAVCLIGAKKTLDGTIPGSPTGTVTPSVAPKVQ